MPEVESTYNETVSKISGLSNAELDQELERAAILNEKSEMLLCCFLAAVRERRAFVDFGYSNLYDYAYARFAFGVRKTRYLVSLGLKIERLPQIREALASGKIGWCKASRLASVATPENEVMWLESALSLTVQQLERRIRDGTDSLASVLHLPLSEERRILWEHALEIQRRRAGAEISPVEAFELMCAELIAGWAHCVTDAETTDTSTPDVTEEAEEAETHDADPVTPESEPSADEEPDPAHDACEQAPLFPWAEASEGNSVSSWEDERAAENEFATNAEYNQVRHIVLERDAWKCTYPGCGARARLHVHHVRYRSRGGCDSPWNLTVVCHFHHLLIHSEQVSVKGRAPHALEWTPPKLMQAVLDRRRNNPSIWAGDLDVREWSLETRAPPSTA